MEQVCVWPDGTWCYKDELPEMTHMSDDYYITSYDEALELGEIKD
ncbi:hypothetical protein HOS22_gp36 [Rhizobium phage RHEph08]|uniref:Uncharacterized protein n=3 Tax=Cuernavacavirus TaxID=2731935 RepID=L7TLP1_9CAUD|nr:hypothetical protein HOS21_gp35 [Rhizobium phage RHEph02]YP_009793219.1 hypothetical protein HOS22_gp36 [Rhizobium phage RHEph08]YP_009793273.1 hypothetical protein HOS23_gp31 [Rhizobium phage RHEph09]AGC35602.1 hypothetical protein RHEph02_gp035 [Rhizobium phage RHEph02]AGC35960.1 hypothetical protein RHEph08_gp036 [Rhizobium phage RHEph08]AGC36014.1 hypothetical protein RHEph09_gp031 [Rhizobium phage RHEph09]